MKSPLAFGVGAASGAIIACTLLLIPASNHHLKNEAQIAKLRDDLSRAQEAAQRDREALRASLQQLQVAR
jgi:hypothetical protein